MCDHKGTSYYKINNNIETAKQVWTEESTNTEVPVIENHGNTKVFK